MRRTFATTLTGFSFLGAVLWSLNLGCSGTVLTSDPGGGGGNGPDAGGGPTLGPGAGSGGGGGTATGTGGGGGGGAGGPGSGGAGGGGGGATLGQPEAGAGASYGTQVFNGVEGGPGLLFTDDVNVYWTQGGPAVSATGAIWSAALNGSYAMPEYVATLAAANNGAPPPYLLKPAICAETIYWADAGAGAIESCFAGGCDSPATVPGTQGATTVLCDDANLYWVNDSDQLLACPRSGCTTPTVLTRTSGMAWVWALDGNTIVFQDGNGVSSCPTTGCASPTQITADQPGFGVAAANGIVVWTSYDEILSCSDTACATPTVLEQESNELGNLATDGVNVYWSDIVQPASPSDPPSANIWKCAIGGCGRSPTKVLSASGLVRDLIVSSKSVVWAGSANIGGDEWIWVTPK